MARWSAFLLAFSVMAARADDAPKPDEPKLRAALTKSLAFLAKEGDEWTGARDCNGCHHMPLLLWGQREAKLRGFMLEQKLADEFVKWADSHATNIGPGLEMTAFMKLAMPGKPMPELTRLIVKGQQPDGSWKPAGQFAGMQRRGAPDAAGNSARVFLLALSTDEADRQAADDARTKAAALLAKNEPATATETLVFRTLYARRFGKPEEVDALLAGILKLQHADGGWASVIGEAVSDSLATGQVLYVLQQSPDSASAAAIARAQNWLLGTQREDGGWPIDLTRISKVDRSAPAKAKSLKDATAIYTYFGSAWATIGLLQGVPVKVENAK